jgi:hypothetical protein
VETKQKLSEETTATISMQASKPPPSPRACAADETLGADGRGQIELDKTAENYRRVHLERQGGRLRLRVGPVEQRKR